MPWVFLDDGLEPGTYSDLQGAEWDAAIVSEANRFAKKARDSIWMVRPFDYCTSNKRLHLTRSDDVSYVRCVRVG